MLNAEDQPVGDDVAAVDAKPSLHVESREVRIPKGAKYWAVRIGVGVGGAVSTTWIIYAGSAPMLAIYLSVLACIGAHEFYRAVRSQNAEPTEFIGIAACILFQAAPFFPTVMGVHDVMPFLLSTLMIVTLLVELTKSGVRPIPNVGTTILGSLYVGMLLSFFSKLRLLDHAHVTMGNPVTAEHVGAWLVIFVCLVTWMSDTMGLVTGYMFGKHKLAPAISPAKTWEGAIGGVLCATLFGAAVGSWLQIGLVHAVILSFLMGLMGLLGDLCESALKRDLGLKDFGTIFANHGGVLDRIDSLLFTAPLSYYYILFFMQPR
ncbi:MAG TPA: phosphatidate cytidylyltransferase [Capsulimonadaceae bacterium]|jgi:phosphatidate cytidylyltransferase